MKAKEGLSVVLSNDRKKVEKQIEALEWQLTQPEDDLSRQIHQETLEQLKAHLNTLQGELYGENSWEELNNDTANCEAIERICKWSRSQPIVMEIAVINSDKECGQNPED